MPRLISVEEALASAVRVGNPDDEATRARIVTAIEEATSRFCGSAKSPDGGYTRRRLRAPASAYTEYHSLRLARAELHLLDWPITDAAAVMVHEDPAWESLPSADRYAASTLLVLGTDYTIDKAHGTLIRIGNSWATGRRAIRVQYTAGFALADVPPDIKRRCKDLVARMYREDDKREHGIASRTDAAGTITRLLPAELTTLDREALKPEQRPHGCSGTRDDEPADVDDDA